MNLVTFTCDFLGECKSSKICCKINLKFYFECI